MLRQRMYHFTLYSLSGIQKGIQSYHSGIEYALKYFDTPEFKQWSEKDKTVIILDGGTSNRMGYTEYDTDVQLGKAYNNFGSMEDIGDELKRNNIKFAAFYEPDLNNATTALSLLVDERVWDWETYPTITARELGLDYVTKQDKVHSDSVIKKKYTELYGEEVAFLKMYLPQFKLANN